MNPQSGRWVVENADTLRFLNPGESDDGDLIYTARRSVRAVVQPSAFAALVRLVERSSEPVQEEAERPQMTVREMRKARCRGAIVQVQGPDGEWNDLPRIAAKVPEWWTVVARAIPKPATRTIRADEVRPGMTVVMHGSPAVVDSAITYDNPPFDQPWVFMHWVYSNGPESVSGGRCIARGHRFQLDEPVSVLAPVPTGEGTGE